VEAFGFAILEAMAYGVPVISSNHFAIPEIIDHEVDGLLVDHRSYDTDAMFRGYRINHLPQPFFDDVTEQLYGFMRRLIESPQLCASLAEKARAKVCSKFSFTVRNQTMRRIYEECLA
jgi:glycosyltransferase involved in cell wall biosynthesis